MKAISATFALLLFSGALAQDAFTNLFNSATQSALRSVGGAASTTSGSPASTPATAAPAATVLEFKSSPQISAQMRETVLKALLDAARSNGKYTAAVEKQLRDTIGKTDIMKTYAPTLQSKGYKVNNLATAVTVWVMTSFGIIQGTDTTDAQDKAVFNQFQRAMSANAAIKKLSDADKQKAAEGLMWLTAFQYNDYQQAQKGAAGYDMDKVVSQTKELLNTYMHIDADQIRVTDTGLAAKTQ